MEKRITDTNQIKKTQTAALFLTVSAAGKVFYLPSLIAADTGRGLWITAVILLFAEWLALFAVYLVMKKNPGKTLGEILTAGVGKVGAAAVLLALCAFFTLRFTALASEIFDFNNFVTVLAVNWFVFALPLFCVLGFLAYKGLNAAARAGGLFLPFVFGAFAASLAFAALRFEWTDAAPALAESRGTLLPSLFKFNAYFSDAALFLMFLGRSGAPEEHAKKPRAALITASALHLITLSSFFVLFTAVSGPAARETPFAFTALARNVNVINLFGRLDRALTAVFLFGFFLKGGLLLAGALDAPMQAFSIKCRYKKTALLFLILLTALILPACFRTGFFQKELLSSVWFSWASAAFGFALPVLLLLLVKKRVPRGGEDNRSEQKN